ncbi:MAG: hypothetical protein AAF495_01530 [Pseudomonadota bacterium]
MYILTRKQAIIAVLMIGSMMLSACGPTAIHKGAARGAQMSVDLDADLQTVIDAQNELYEARLDNAVLTINDLYLNTQRLYLQREAESFAKANVNTTAEKMGPKMVTFMSTSMRNWVARHKAYSDLLMEAEGKFAESTAKVEQDRAKLRALQSRFVALSNPKSREEALKFLIAFAKDVKSDLDRRQADLDEAAEVQPSVETTQ